jgi:hypothetical protein
MSVSKSKTRSSFSYLCMVCDDEAIQRVLPQVLLVSNKMVPSKELQIIRSQLPANVHIQYADSSWTTTAQLQWVLKLLAKSLGDRLSDRQVILSLDCFRAHITQPIWRQCKAQNIFYFIIPAKTTWVLQPCDTHVFASVKRCFEKRCLEAMLAHPNGVLTTQNVFQSLAACIGEVVCSRSWLQAFRDTGLTGDQTLVSSRVLQKLGIEYAPIVGAGLPTLSMLQNIFPKNCIIPITLVFGCFFEGPEEKTTSPFRSSVKTRSSSRAELAAVPAPVVPTIVGSSSGLPWPPAAPLSPRLPSAGSGASSAAAADPLEAAAPAAEPAEKESLSAAIWRLKTEQAAARLARKRLSKELHNAQRRASRLKKRARQLTDGDLLEVLRMREHKVVDAVAAAAPLVQQPPLKAVVGEADVEEA